MALDNLIGPSTAGLAQRIGRKYGIEEDKLGSKYDSENNFKILKRSYVMPCTTNQF